MVQDDKNETTKKFYTRAKIYIYLHSKLVFRFIIRMRLAGYEKYVLVVYIRHIHIRYIVYLTYMNLA